MLVKCFLAKEPFDIIRVALHRLVFAEAGDPRALSRAVGLRKYAHSRPAIQTPLLTAGGVSERSLSEGESEREREQKSLTLTAVRQTVTVSG